MKLSHGLHLAYCTNIHRGETWSETWEALRQHTLQVRAAVSPDRPYAIGLRLSQIAARELAAPSTLTHFRKWLKDENCYVFTINGFPFGQFHGTRVKEQVYAPDWTTAARLAYTNLLFDILGELVPEGIEGSVSTVPGSFKPFIKSKAQVAEMRANLLRCVDHITAVQERTGKRLHLGLEPEPLCFLENSVETADFFHDLRTDSPHDGRLNECLGVNYDTCHLAIEFEEPAEVMRRFRENRIRISKLHLSSALKVRPNPDVRAALRAFADDTYFHQVISRGPSGELRRYKDLDEALDNAQSPGRIAGETEWRIHFHIPLNSPPTALFGQTTDHLLGVLDLLREDPAICSHLEMETYTWEVMPPELKKRNVVAQLVAEYEWTLRALAERGIKPQ